MDMINYRNNIKKFAKIIVYGVNLTPVQKQIIDECEPMIVHLQELAKEEIDKILEKFEKYRLSMVKEEERKIEQNENIDKSETVFKKIKKEYTKNEFEIEVIFSCYDIENYSRGNWLYKHLYLPKSRKEYFYKNTLESIRTFNLQKLTQALIKYVTSDYVEIKNFKIFQGPKGFEITAILIDNQKREWNFKTQAISAGGYNIQVWHYRYIINLYSKEVPREKVKQDVKERIIQEQEEKKKERARLVIERENQEKVKKTLYVIKQIGSVVNNNLKTIESLKKQLADDKKLKEKMHHLTHSYLETKGMIENGELTEEGIVYLKDQYKITIEKTEKENAALKSFYDKFFKNGKMIYSKEQLEEKILNGEVKMTDFANIDKYVIEMPYNLERWNI